MYIITLFCHYENWLGHTSWRPIHNGSPKTNGWRHGGYDNHFYTVYVTQALNSLLGSGFRHTLLSALTYKHKDTQWQGHVYSVEFSDICLKWNSCGWIGVINSVCVLCSFCKHTKRVYILYEYLNPGWKCSTCLHLKQAMVFGREAGKVLSTLFCSPPPSISPCVYTLPTLCLEIIDNPCMAVLQMFML